MAETNLVPYNIENEGDQGGQLEKQGITDISDNGGEQGAGQMNKQVITGITLKLIMEASRVASWTSKGSQRLRGRGNLIADNT